MARLAVEKHKTDSEIGGNLCRNLMGPASEPSQRPTTNVGVLLALDIGSRSNWKLPKPEAWIV